jgi:hypothetical protein
MNSRRMIVPSKKVGEMGTGRPVTALRLIPDRREILWSPVQRQKANGAAM